MNDVINAKSHLWIFKCNQMLKKLRISLIKFDDNIFLKIRFIIKTRSCNFDHLIPNFYIVKVGLRQGNTFFFFFWLKNTHILVSSKTTTKLSQFSHENYHFYSGKNPAAC